MKGEGRGHTGTATLIPICPGSACSSNFLAAAPLLVYHQRFTFVSHDQNAQREQLHFHYLVSYTIVDSGVTYYLLALMISIASSIVSAATILKTGPKISFLTSVSNQSSGWTHL
jgi:hypothetical protein